MDIKSDIFAALWANVRRISTDSAKIDLHSDTTELELDTELGSYGGVEVDVEELELTQGVLSYKGRQVLLFIPDHDRKIDAKLAGSIEGNKYHVADCKTLDTMKQRNRFNRYKVTNNLEGVFNIYGVDSVSGAPKEADVELFVCKNCLSYLRYQGYSYKGSKAKNDQIYNNFSVDEFLTQYSTLFRRMPTRAPGIEKGGYSEDWKEISVRVRSERKYTCEECAIDLNDHPRLLHVHHVNGNKRDNSESNLRALCVDCHRKQPKHGYLRVTHDDMRIITNKRREIGLPERGDWTEVHSLVDKALDGLVHFYEEKRLPIPEVGYELVNPQTLAVVGELELAWPERRWAVAIEEDDLLASRKLGWTALSVGEALKNMSAQRAF